jgi:hypothetical protein
MAVIDQARAIVAEYSDQGQPLECSTKRKRHRSTVARDLRSPKYRHRVARDKSKYVRKRKFKESESNEP